MNENDWFRDRIALVTGASSGIGAEVSASLGAAGARVGVHYRANREGAESVRSRVESAGAQAVLLQAHLGQPDQVHRMFDELEDAFGRRLDLLVNNAGEWMDKTPLAECSEEIWDRMMEVNAKSVFLCCQRAVHLMRERAEGSIVNVGSIAGHTGGGGGTVPYAAAKAAVHTLTRGLARELGPEGIRVNGVAPGMVETRMLEGRLTRETALALKAMTPMRRMAEPIEIARIVMMLSSPSASFMTGEIVEVNGGLLMR